MSERDIEVELTGPAKIYGIREPAGKTVFVSTALALQLAASGVINPEDAAGLAATVDASGQSPAGDDHHAFDTAVAEKAKLLAETMVAEVVAAAVAEVVTPVEAERDQVQARVKQLEQQVADLETKLAAATKTPPATTTKTTAKKA